MRTHSTSTPAGDHRPPASSRTSNNSAMSAAASVDRPLPVCCCRPPVDAILFASLILQAGNRRAAVADGLYVYLYIAQCSM